MKKTITKFFAVAALFVVMGVSANAQVRFGAQLGANLANMTGDVTDNSMKIGIHGGIFARISVNDNLSVEPAALYSMKGYKVEIGDESENFKADYVEIPINIKYMMESGFNLFVGPYIGLLMSAKFGDLDVKDGMKSMDFGVNIGLGYEMESGLGFQARYGLGLANTLDAEGSDASIKNAVIGVGLTYAFGGE